MKKTVIAILLCTALCVTAFSQTGDDFDIAQKADGTLAITHYNGKTQQVIIPRTIEGIKVTEIRRNTFRFLTPHSITIPDSVTIIEKGAFRLCIGLTSITIGANKNYAGSEFPHNFEDFYISQGRKAGTYTWSGRLWSVKK